MKDSRWERGLFFPKLFIEAESIAQTCCLKTHRFGLGRHSGQIFPIDNHNFMNELHSSPT